MWVFAACALLGVSSAATHHKKGVAARTAACQEWFAIPAGQRPHKKECEGWSSPTTIETNTALWWPNVDTYDTALFAL